MARRTSFLTRIAVLVALVCALVSLKRSTPVHAQQSCGPRVRKAWATLATPEKQLYLDAVMAAMATGNHALFIEVHGDTASGNEGHRTCGMIYWHRRFLLAYENMLRSLEPRFACVTIPYWDYYTDYARKLAKLCTTFEDCSRILNEFGGSIGPAHTNTFIDGVPLPGGCVNGSQVPTSWGIETNFSLAGFCQSSSTTNCWGCLPRDNWTAKAFPGGFGLGTIAKYISGSYGFAWFAQNIHYGVHNSIHNTLGSTMATLWTSADPIFYNHHSTIDLVHQMWYDCQVQRPMTELEKKLSGYAFQLCSLTLLDICPTALSPIKQYWWDGSNPWSRVRVEDHPVLGQYFGPLPSYYWQYVSGTDLGAYSYSYEKDSLLTAFNNANISIGCPLNSKARRLADVKNTKSSNKPLAAAPQNSLNLFTQLVNVSMAKIEELYPTLPASEKRTEALGQLENMDCMWYLEQQGAVDDYTTYFRTNWRLPADAHTSCYKIIQQLRSGLKTIVITNWRDIFTNYLETASLAT